MKRVERVALSAIALLLVASMILSACAPAPAPAPAQQPAAAAATKAPEAAKPAAPSDKPVTLSLWGGFPEMEPFYKHVAEAYTKEHPNVKIEILTHPLREFEQKLSATIPSDTAADIIEISMYANQKFIEADLIPELPANVKAFMEEKGRYSDFLQSNNTYKGKKYGLPLFVGRTALFWNKDMFKEAGLSAPPKTQQEMADFAKKLAKADAAGTLTRAGHSLRLSGQGSGVAEKWWFILWPLGGTIVKDAGNGKYCAGYNNDAGKQALKFYVDAVHVDKYDSHALKHDAEAFELGLAAMLLRESWVIGDIAKKAPNLNYDTAPVPSAAQWGRITNPVNLYVTRAAKNPEVAWDFAQFMMKPEHMNWLLENVGWLPARGDIDLSAVLAKIPQFKAFVMSDPNYKEFGYPVIAPFDEIMTKLAERLVTAYLDKSLANNPDGIAKTIEAAANETNEILKKAGLYAECK